MRAHCYAVTMPRRVDVEQQREMLAGAAARLVARAGLEAVSLRTTAAEAGVSMGRVQHYFATKDDLLLEALKHAYRGMEARIEERLAHGAADERETLVAILEELLAEHHATRDAIRINAAFAARALRDERVAAVVTDGDHEIEALAIAVVADAQAKGLVDRDVNAELDGKSLFALATGLGIQVALYGASPISALSILRHNLERLAPGGPNQPPRQHC